MAGFTRYSDYDRFAWVYDRHWGSGERRLPALERLMLRHLASDARILDLCCGTGHGTQVLLQRGYRVDGLDGSEEMIRFARDKAPEGNFIIEDVRTFKSPAMYDGVISLFDSLNHVMNLDELTLSFRNVHAALVGGGIFLFDLNMEQGYERRWRGSFGIVEDDYACVVRSGYSKEEKVGRFDATMFRFEKEWRRSDVTLLQRCYSEEEVKSALGAAGFAGIRSYDMQGEPDESGSAGSMYFVCRKPA